jgi:hypothetical protein
MGGPDAHLGTSRIDCEACVAQVIAEVQREARAAALEEAAQHVAGKAEWYPVVVFPEGSKSVDSIAAAMGRHCAKVWAESLRLLCAFGAS